MKPLKAHIRHWLHRLETAAVRLWLARPGRLLASFVVVLLLGGFTSLFGAFYLMMNFGIVGSILGALWLMSGMFFFMVFGEPWLSPTGSKFRAEHAWKAEARGVSGYLLHLDGLVRSAGVPCRVNILAGQCPWLLAYGIERCMAPESVASHQAQGLDLATRPIHSNSVSRRL